MIKDDITYAKAFSLQTKLCSLEADKKILSETKEASKIIFQNDKNLQCYQMLDTKYIGFDKIKTMLLREINEQIEITQKEFDEL